MRARRKRIEHQMFQSPSLRGSGRFRQPVTVAGPAGPGLNPLHCGAVVASRSRGSRTPSRSWRVSIPFIAGQWSLQGEWEWDADAGALFQSPSLRGSGRFFPPPYGGGRGASGFQSPSLRGSGRFEVSRSLPTEVSAGFNPLHCGAVVASMSHLVTHCGPRSRFNPLHCGAVVASRLRT